MNAFKHGGRSAEVRHIERLITEGKREANQLLAKALYDEISN
ncbi:MAG: hypothetical protein ACHQAX_09660 [Gammaproteobacteria bacterium]